MAPGLMHDSVSFARLVSRRIRNIIAKCALTSGYFNRLSINRGLLFIPELELTIIVFFNGVWKRRCDLFLCFSTFQEPLQLGGVYTRKLAPARDSHWDDFLISYRVYMMTGSFHILLFNGTFHVDKIHVWFKIANITHALPVPVY